MNQITYRVDQGIRP